MLLNSQEIRIKEYLKKELEGYSGKFNSQFLFLQAIACRKLVDELVSDDLDIDALIVAAYLHDIGRVKTDDENHPQESWKLSERIVKEVLISEKQIEVVKDCILNHGSKSKPKTEEGLLMQLIDKVSLFDPDVVSNYVDLVLQKGLSDNIKKEILSSLHKWYDKLGERRKEFKSIYEKAVFIVLNRLNIIELRISVLNKYDEKLIGLKALPLIEREKYPAVILAHAFGSSKEESGMFDEITQKLSEVGILVFRFDFSGCGESEGKFSETSLSKLKSDLSVILEYVKFDSQVDVSKIGILAQSLSTSTTITLEPDVNCLVMMGSVAHPKEILVELFGDGYDPNNISTRVKPHGEVQKVGPQFWSDFSNHFLLESIKNIHSRILFIHGAEDDKVPLSEMEAYFTLANEPKEKIVIDKANHILKPNRGEAYQVITDWLKFNLCDVK